MPIPLVIFAFSFCRFTCRLFLSSFLFEEKSYAPPDSLFISSYTVLTFNQFTHFFPAFRKTSSDVRKYGLEF